VLALDLELIQKTSAAETDLNVVMTCRRWFYRRLRAPPKARRSS
jgi:hypothetical protein